MQEELETLQEKLKLYEHTVVVCSETMKDCTEACLKARMVLQNPVYPNERRMAQEAISETLKHITQAQKMVDQLER